MKRDPLFFRLFKELPGCFFQLVGRSERDAERYILEAIEYKATSVRLDGLFRPLQPGDDPFPKWSRVEIAKMLQVTDVTQTRVYQEGVEDGLVKGRQEGIEEGIETVALRLLKMGRPVAEIAQATGLTSAQIRKLSKKSKK